MNNISSKLTVLFEDPFWIGIFESESDKCYEVAKVVFGPEPTEVQLYEFINNQFYFIPFSKSNDTINILKDNIIGYKRFQRKIKKQQSQCSIGTKAQNAIKIQQESKKFERKNESKIRKELEQERLFKLKQIKKKEKHKGH